jgi:hypothetical protein
MRLGKWRGTAVAAALASVIATGLAESAGASGFTRTIPREVVAVDVNTGGPNFAPPIPYGHYAKDCLGSIQNAVGLLKGGLFGRCLGCGGDGCGRCGGGLFGHDGCGDPGCGGCGGGLLHRNVCVACGGSGCGFCEGHGLLQKKACGHCGAGCGTCVGKASTIVASTQAAPTPQASTPSPQFVCSEPGCHIGRKHFHRRGRGCNACGGRGSGCRICGGGLLGVDPCGACGGRGCGLCGRGRGPCGACGGRGCRLCLGARSLLNLPHALVGKLFHVGEIKYFVGPGGPVPLTPGYVPYVVTTRSPRDFFAFPPFSPLDP